MDVERQFQSRSHSFGSFGASPPTTMLILPSFVMSTRTFSTPAARAARIARVMSDCRNVEGARAMGATENSLMRGHRGIAADCCEPCCRALLVQRFRFQARPTDGFDTSHVVALAAVDAVRVRRTIIEDAEAIGHRCKVLAGRAERGPAGHCAGAPVREPGNVEAVVGG